ncbi:hypothetical protein C8R43DRAFT_1122900 [Mycena crocata]|nr:hypothetical protein C8R43DRAFT_1122900 [Mycena crocata]
MSHFRINPGTEGDTVYPSASLLSTTLHPYRHFGPIGSRSSPNITTFPIPQDSYALHSLSVQHLPPGPALQVQNLPATLSVQNLPPLPPSPNPGSSYLPSPISSVSEISLPVLAIQSRRTSVTFGDVELSSAPLLNKGYPRIFPGTPDSVRRYEQKVVALNEATQFTIPSLTESVLPVEPPPGWTVCMHPEGAQYFFHEEKRVFTDANLYDETLLEFMNTNVYNIHDFLRANGIQLKPHVDLVVDEYLYSDKTRGCQYYFVNHQDRSVFWVDHVRSDEILTTPGVNINGITTASHIRHVLEYQYWFHCELFPKSWKVTHDVVDELRDILLHALGDLLTSKTSTVSSSWKIEELKHMISLTDGVRGSVDRNMHNKFSGTNCLVARLMHIQICARVIHFYGQPNARLNVDQSVYAPDQKRTLLIRLLSPIIFYAPAVHLRKLRIIYGDGLIRHRTWSEFIEKLTGEWKSFTLDAHVLLNANMAFLAIQSVDQGGNATPNRSRAQISSYISILASIGSVIIGLLLVKQYRDREHNPVSKTTVGGLETLAILYSLPYAMLIWSMVSFLAAFSFMCFENSSFNTRALVGVLLAAVGTLIFWCIFTAWESREISISPEWLRGFLCWGKSANEAEDQGVAESNIWKIEWVWRSIARGRRSYNQEASAV